MCARAHSSFAVCWQAQAAPHGGGSNRSAAAVKDGAHTKAALPKPARLMDPLGMRPINAQSNNIAMDLFGGAAGDPYDF